MRKRNGFTILEVLVAVMVLTVGILAMASTAALVTRMIGQGQRYSEVSAVASQRIEMMRSRSCSALANGSATSGAYVLTWTVDSVAAGKARSVQVIVVSPVVRGTRADTFATTLPC